MSDDLDFLFAPTPNQEAIDFIKSKPIVSRSIFKGMLPEIKARAFTIAGIEPANVLQAVRDRLADLPAGASWDDVKSDVAADISPYLVDPDATDEERDGQILAANRKAELLVRIHGFQAYQSASYQVMDRQRDALPYWQYLSMEDDRVRPSHDALDKVILPADHEFWQTHFPPWDWGCRCQAVPISQEDRDDVAKDDEDKPVDERSVLSEGELSELTKSRRLATGNGAVIDVSSPAERDEPGAFQWNPADLRIPVDQLKERYDAETWGAFEGWAKRTALQDGSAPTVWNWLSDSDPVGLVPPPPPRPPASPVPPPPRPASPTAVAIPRPPPPPPPRRNFGEWVGQAVGSTEPITAEDVAKIKAALRKPDAVPIEEKLAGISTSDGKKIRGLPEGWEGKIQDIAQEFVSFLPRDAAAALPKIRFEVAKKLGASTGDYNAGLNRVRISPLAFADDRWLRTTIFHEMGHWFHNHGSAALKAAVDEHFAARTKGEAIAHLVGYSKAAVGKADKFWDPYMGRVYDTWEGLEVPSRVMEVLGGDPKVFAALWNNPLHRETISTVLQHLLP